MTKRKRHEQTTPHYAERERAANIAEQIASEHAHGHDEWDEAAEHTARKIAAAIREQ